MNSHRKGDEMNNEYWIPDLEGHLQAVYEPVAPTPEFKRELKKRLLTESSTTLTESRSDFLPNNALTLAGLLSGTLLLVFGGRALLSFLNTLGVFENLKPHTAHKSTTPQTAG
jgi:hypothetical protein